MTPGESAVGRQTRRRLSRRGALALGAMLVPAVLCPLGPFLLRDNAGFAWLGDIRAYRKQFRPVGSRRRWEDTWTMQGQPIDEIMQRSVEDYTPWVGAQGPGDETPQPCPEPSRS